MIQNWDVHLFRTRDGKWRARVESGPHGQAITTAEPTHRDALLVAAGFIEHVERVHRGVP